MKKRLCFLLVVFIAARAMSQVALQNGSATYALPMFSWQDDKSRLNAAVVLNYSSGNGLKVNDVASNVGQGWNLVAGGVITRIEVGEPDDQMPKDGAYNDITKYPPGYLYNTVDASSGCPGALSRYPIFGQDNQLYVQHNSVGADRELDYFSFQFNGRAGLFVLGKNNGDKGIMLGDNKLKISFTRDETMVSQGIRTSITSFTIQDENGLLYKFTKHVLTRVLQQAPYVAHDGLFYSGHDALYDQLPTSANPTIITGWYLTEIDDPLTNRQVTINYTTESINSKGGLEIDYMTDQNNTQTYHVLHRNSIEQAPVIQSIVCPDGHTVTFNYAQFDRYDLPGDHALQSVNVTYNGRAASRYLLNTTYFILNTIDNPVTPTQKHMARLCLKSVQKVDVDLQETEPPYVFDYYTGTNATDDFVPPPFWLLKDAWGYYNGDQLSTLLPSSPDIHPFSQLYTVNTIDPTSNVDLTVYNTLSTLRKEHLRALCYRNATSGDLQWSTTINPGYAKNGLLKQVTYPAGGTLAFEYQQNSAVYPVLTYDPDAATYSDVDHTSIIGGVHVSKTTTTDGGYSNSSTNPVITTYNYTDGTSSNNTSIRMYEAPDSYEPYFQTQTTSHFAAEGSHNNVFSGCSYDYMYPGILSQSQAHSTVGGGNISLVATLQMVISSFAGVIGLAYPPVAVIEGIVEIVAEIVELIIGCSDYAQVGFSNTWSNELNYFENPAPTVFKRLEVTQNSLAGGSNGKAVYEFTSPDDYPLWTPGNMSLSFSQRSADWAYGLTKKITMYDANNNMVKQQENVYDYSHAKEDLGVASCTCVVDEFYSLNSTTWNSLASNPNGVTGDGLSSYIYHMYTGRVELTDSYNRTFKPGDPTQYNEVDTHYDYSPNNYQVAKITTSRSNGDKSIKEIYYVPDYNTSGILQTMEDNNLVNTPVATYNSFPLRVSQYQLGCVGCPTTYDPNYVSGTVTDFTTLANGNIKPSRVLTGESADAVHYQFDATNPFNYPNLVETQTFTYDQGISGNLVGVKDQGNHITTNIYDYNDKYVVASVVNADPNLDKPAYTSFETAGLGGWIVNGTSSIVSLVAATGTGCFVLMPGTNSLQSPSLNTSKPYKVSFWANSSSVLVNGNAAVAKSPQNSHGYTYYEYDVAQGTSTVTLTSGSGNIDIDELRLYPKMARMKTTCYDPLVGKTAECDENNRIINYEYDAQGKLLFVKDDQGNIVKMYENNNKQNGIIGAAKIAAYSTVYARLTYENVYYLGSYTYGDVVIRFYSDAACTQPYVVNNLNVYYSSGVACDNSACNSPNQFFGNVVVTGNSFIIPQSTPLNYQDSGENPDGSESTCSCITSYGLLAGDGYIIVN